MRSTRTLLGSLLVVLLITLVGCAGAPSLAVTTPVADLPTVLPGTAVPPAQVLTGAEGGKTVAVKLGQIVSVQLRDRRWSAPAVDARILQVQPLNVPVPAGVSRWDYKAIAPGTTTLESEGSCLANPGGPACLSIVVYKVTVTVTP